MAGLLLQTPRRAPILEQRQSRSPAPRQGPPLPRQSQSPAPMPGQPPPRQSQSRALATARAPESRPLPRRPPQRGRLAGQMQAALAAQMPARRAQTAPPAAAARMVLHPLPAGTEPPLLRAGLQGRPPARPRPATPPAGLLRTAPQGRLPAAAARGIQARQKGRGPRLLRWSGASWWRGDRGAPTAGSTKTKAEAREAHRSRTQHPAAASAAVGHPLTTACAPTFPIGDCRVLGRPWAPVMRSGLSSVVFLDRELAIGPNSENCRPSLLPPSSCRAPESGAAARWLTVMQ